MGEKTADRAEEETTHPYMNIESERSEFTRLDEKPSFWRSIFDKKWSFWRPVIAGKFKKNFGNMNTRKNWRRVLLSACVVALAIDPLFYLIPLINSDEFCFTFDKALAVVVCVLRTFFDIFYLFHIIFHFITAFKVPPPQVSSASESTEHQSSQNQPKIIKKAVSFIFYLIVDILSILPIPQVLVLVLIRHSDLLVSNEILKWTIICQYVPRFFRTYLILMKVIRPSGSVAESKWIGATINFLFYMLFSYGFGAYWYVSAIEKQNTCWREACERQPNVCDTKHLFCSSKYNNNTVFLNTTCELIAPTEIPRNSTVFNFGMYTDALRSGVLEEKNNGFSRKFIYCFRWGLRNISSLGQNLETSNFAGENVLAIVICVSGLLLFAILIGNVQMHLQSSTTRVDEKEENERDRETWMSKRKLPKDLKDVIRKHEDYKWRETRGMQEETLLQSIPKHLIKDIRRQIYGGLIDRLKLVPQFQKMDDWSVEVLYSHLKTAYYTEDSYIVQEGRPVENMLFIVSGKLEVTTSYGGKAGLCAGHLCGEELFHWAFDSQSSNYLTSSITVKAITEVEGFLLSADDLKFIATQNGPQNRQDMSP